MRYIVEICEMCSLILHYVTLHRGYVEIFRALLDYVSLSWNMFEIFELDDLIYELILDTKSFYNNILAYKELCEVMLDYVRLV